MKKIFTLVCALMGIAGAANASTVNDIEPLKHSYVLVCDQLGSRPGEGKLFGDNHFLDVKGGTTATNKGTVDLSVADGNDGYVTEEIVAKYGEDYAGPHYNWLRLKNTQDMIALKPTAGSKIIVFLQGNNKTGKDARYPRLSKNADLSDALNSEPTADFTEKTVSGYRFEFTVPNGWGTDDVLYMGSYNGDMFVSFIIVEANETEGTPSLKVGGQTYENGLWYREVTCKTAEVGGVKTVATYTTDGSTPTENSTVYTGPVKVYSNQLLKFQAFYDYDEVGHPDEIIEGADNEIGVSFTFDAPTIQANGANVEIVSPYADAKNFYSINGGAAQEGSSFTLDESATITAYSEIVNSSYATFTTFSATSDVYVLTPLKEKKTITVTAGTATEDPNNAEDWIVEGGAISADKADFFVKNLTFGVVKDEKYQIDGKEVYIKMSNTNITFKVAEGDSVDVKVICSKNSCRNIDKEVLKDQAGNDSIDNDRKCYVNVDGTTYGGEDLAINPDGNVITFGLTGGIHTFLKYSGTGNILISSIEITPVEGGASGISIVKAADAQSSAIYNLAGQKVTEAYKGVVIKNGKKVVLK